MWMRKTANTISGRTAGPSGRGLWAFVLCGAFVLWAGLNAPQAAAHGRGYGYEASVPSGYGVSSNYANPTDALMYPCFGQLIYPSPNRCRAYPSYGQGYGYGYGYGYYSSSVNIDCDRDSYREIMYKVRRVRTGGAAYFSGARCKVSLDRDSSLAIIGKARNGVYPVIEALDGQACLRVGPLANKVVVRNITFVASRGQRASCIESSARELTLVNSNLRYDGEDSAIKIEAGRFNLYNTNVVARTLTSAIEIDDASFYAENSRIASTYNGIRGNIVNDSRVVGLTFIQLGDWQGFVRGEGAKAIDLKLLTSGSVITMDQIKVLFYGNGLYLSGEGEALVSNSLFYSDHAITSSIDRVRILNNYIFSDEVGIDLQDGDAYVGNNHIQLVRTAGIATAKDAKLRAVNNHIMTLNCEQLRDNNRAPGERSCTPWFKDAAFGIPGGGVDWSLNALLEEACVKAPNDQRAAGLCDRYRARPASSVRSADTVEPYDVIMSRACASIGSTASTSCKDFYARQKVVDRIKSENPGTESLSDLEAKVTKARDQKISDYDNKAFLDACLKPSEKISAECKADSRVVAILKLAKDVNDVSDQQRLTMEALKAECDPSYGYAVNKKVPGAWSDKPGICPNVAPAGAVANSGKPYEDDETNRDLTGGKEWLMTLLYENNEREPSRLYTLSATTFMPLFDNYRPEYVYEKPRETSTDYFKAPSPKLPKKAPQQ